MDSPMFDGELVHSSRILYTPSPFARTNLLHLQEVGSLQARRPHASARQGLASYLVFLVESGSGTLESILAYEPVLRIDGKGGPTFASLEDMPEGCRFFNRCKYACKICEEKDPGLVDYGTGKVRCWMYREDAPEEMKKMLGQFNEDTAQAEWNNNEK